MVDSANAFAASDSEFAETGFTSIPSIKIAAPRVKEVPIHFECNSNAYLNSALTGILWSLAK
jgi:flavin reductase (DIM6/NTAB) family NADH-FMN oxidoreductase RutF